MDRAQIRFRGVQARYARRDPYLRRPRHRYGWRPRACRSTQRRHPTQPQPQPDPARILYWDDHIQPMLTHPANYRDLAAIALSWDLGPRPFEFRDLRVGDIIDHEHGMKVSVDGKTGERSVLVIPSVSYVRQWLSVHPDSETPTAPSWCKLNAAEALSHRMVLNMLQTPLRRPTLTTRTSRCGGCGSLRRGMSHPRTSIRRIWRIIMCGRGEVRSRPDTLPNSGKRTTARLRRPTVSGSMHRRSRIRPRQLTVRAVDAMRRGGKPAYRRPDFAPAGFRALYLSLRVL